MVNGLPVPANDSTVPYGQGFDKVFRVGKHQGQRLASVEVEALLRRLRDLGVLIAYLAAKRIYINGGRANFGCHFCPPI
jgi:hypothetical protein